MSVEVRLEPWDEGDLALVEQLFGDPRMMKHLGWLDLDAGPHPPRADRGSPSSGRR